MSDRGEWLVRLRGASRDGAARAVSLGNVEEVPRALAEIARHVKSEEFAPSVQVHPHAPGPFSTPGCDSFFAATCLSIVIHLPDLFTCGGPLHDPALFRSDGRPVEGVMGAGRLQKARRFAAAHARGLVFAPAAAIASYDAVYLFFLLDEPRSLLEREKATIERIQEQLARFVHGGHARRIGSWSPLPMITERGGQRAARARVLWARHGTTYSLEQLDEWTRDLGAEEPFRAGPTTAAKRSLGGAPELRLRTLMDDYGLAELELPAPIKQLIAAGSCSGEIMILDEVPVLVSTMAQAGYGFEDVRLVLSDSRFPLSYTARIGDTHQRGLGLKFRNALRAVRSAYRPRLPYSIRRIQLISDGDDRIADRYVIEGGSASTPFRIEVTHDVLMSARRFHRALSSHLRDFPYRVPQEVWEQVLLRRGLRDPRVRLAGLAPRDPPEAPLTARIEVFAAEAQPLTPGLWESDDRIPWPVLRDGLVVFRLAVLRGWLARRVSGPAPRRGEVTDAVRAAGGAPYGAMRFGKRVIRVWTLPYHGRPIGSRGSGSA